MAGSIDEAGPLDSALVSAPGEVSSVRGTGGGLSLGRALRASLGLDLSVFEDDVRVAVGIATAPSWMASSGTMSVCFDCQRHSSRPVSGLNAVTVLPKVTTAGPWRPRIMMLSCPLPATGKR